LNYSDVSESLDSDNTYDGDYVPLPGWDEISEDDDDISEDEQAYVHTLSSSNESVQIIEEKLKVD